MKVKLDRYPLMEIVLEFSKRGWGHEEIVLEALTEGALICSIEFPSYIPEKIQEIPADYWESIDPSELITGAHKHAGKSSVENITVAGEALYDHEFGRLKTIAKAAAERDPTLIDKELISCVLDSLDISSLSGFDDWYNLIRVFSELQEALQEQRREKFTAYVTNEDWEQFCRTRVKVDTSDNKKKRGRNPNEYWPDILWALIDLISEKQKMGLQELTGVNSYLKLARIIRKQVLEEKSLQPRVLNGEGTIEEKIRERDPIKKLSPKTRN